MRAKERQQKIIEILSQQNFTSTGELSQILDVSEMTIWRDLKVLEGANLIKRTYGGAIPAGDYKDKFVKNLKGPSSIKSCTSDVVVVTSANPKQRFTFLEREPNKSPPLITESTPYPSAVTQVGIDDYQAGFDLGGWVGDYAKTHWGGTVNVLIWSYALPNTEARGRGFLTGLAESAPVLGDVISLNPTVRDDLAYQLTRDALEVNKDINVIFAMNDNNAWGAIQACIELGIDPHQTIVIPFGLGGDLLKNALRDNLYCPVGLAMFPEIVGRVCMDAAIAAYNHEKLPEKIVTPYQVLTKETLPHYYRAHNDGWDFLWEAAQNRPGFNWKDIGITPSEKRQNPNCIGLVLTFPNHEWYQNLVTSMTQYANFHDIELEILDVERNLREELISIKHMIANKAALEIQPGDTIFISGGTVTQFLAEYLHDKIDLTVITNSRTIFKKLEAMSNITLISTGGILRRDSQALVGPNTENVIKDIRVDKLFITVSGVSFEFGLSHTEISEVTIKQAMIKSTREVILLADHTKFEQESLIQIAPIEVVDKLITDAELAPNIRLELNQANIDVIIT